MFRRLSLSKSWAGMLLLAFLTGPAVAHEVEVAGDVAATFHLEPHHNPRAGEPAQVWFALTRQGGKIIPLAQCNCQLAIYPQPKVAGSQPLLQPALQPITAEQYQGIPGAEIVFPQPGAYELALSGTPKAGASFQPFELSYRVIVGVGAAPASSPSTSPQLEQTAEPQAMTEQPAAQWQVPAAVAAIGLGIGAIVFWVKKQKR